MIKTTSKGSRLASLLGLTIIGSERHDLTGPCVLGCQSSDAFRLHENSGISQCYSCHAKSNAYDLCVKIVGAERAESVMIEAGLFKPRQIATPVAGDVLGKLAAEKRCSAESLKKFGAKVEGGTVVIPMFGPDLKNCSTFSMRPGATDIYKKGKNAWKKETGLFIAEDFPDPGNACHLVEGVKDAAALLDLAVSFPIGLPGSTLPKDRDFEKLFAGVDVVLIPDLDDASARGAEDTARRLHGIARSIKIVDLPGERKKSKGLDCRDILALPGGRELLLAAIGAAREWDPAAPTKRSKKIERLIPEKVRGEPAGIIYPEGQTDVANGMRLARLHGDDLRWIDSWRKFLVWDGQRWAADNSPQVDRWAKEVAAGIFQEIATVAPKIDDGLLDELIRFAKKSASKAAIEAMRSLVRSEPGISISAGQLDRDPLLFNAANGTLDLRTGQLRDHRRDDHLTQLCPVAYKPDAECDTWIECIYRMAGADPDLADYLQRAVGLSISGEVPEHALFIAYGPGGTGKSTFLKTIIDLLGPDYAIKGTRELLMAGAATHSTDRADLCGKRFVAVVETDSGQRFAEATVKELTGGDSIRARKMRQDNSEFVPTHKVWLSTNHKPIVRGTDEGIWRRMRAIPFTVPVPDEEQDKRLVQKLAMEREGILRWIVDGYMSYREIGLKPPDCVREATDQYRLEMDTIAKFVESCCMVGPDERAQGRMLHDAFVEWNGGVSPMPPKFFFQRIEQTYPKRKSHGVMIYEGIGLPASARLSGRNRDAGEHGELGDTTSPSAL